MMPDADVEDPDLAGTAHDQGRLIPLRPQLLPPLPPAARQSQETGFSAAHLGFRTVTPELMEAMHKLADREIKAGRMLDNGGLMPVATGAQVRIADGKLSVIDGPFVEAKEVIGGYAIFELRDKEEAVAMAVEFMQLHLDFMPGWEGTCELRAFAGP
jgi:hypothetical protein